MKTSAIPSVVVRDVPYTIEVFRIVRDDSLSSVADSLRSNYELGRVPRGVEQAWPVIQRGVSVFMVDTVAREVAQKFPKLGKYLARIVLPPGQGFNLAETGQPLHLTIWADPVKLRDAIADIGPI